MNKLTTIVIAALTLNLAACSNEDPTDEIATESALTEPLEIADMETQATWLEGSSDDDKHAHALWTPERRFAQKAVTFVYHQDVLPAEDGKNPKGGR